MKTYAPRLTGHDLRRIIEELHATPLEIAKFLQVTERSVWRWLADNNAPFAALAALWHETRTGRHASACDVGNEARYLAGERNSLRDELTRASARLARVLAISETGAANDPFSVGPVVSRMPAPATTATALSSTPLPMALAQSAARPAARPRLP